MAKSLIHIDKEIKDKIKGHLGDISFEEFFSVVNKMFSEGVIKVDGKEIIFSGGIQYFEHPLIEEFKEACESRSMDWEYGLKKAVNAIKERKL